MFKLVFFVGLLSVLQLASGRVVREAPDNTDGSTLTLKELTDKAETAYETLHQNVLKFANVSTDEELGSLVRTQTETYANKLKTIATQLGEEVKSHSGNMEDFFKKIVDTFNATANELKANNPALATFEDTIEKGIKNVLDESEKFRNRLKEDGAEISQNAETILKKVYEDTVETAKSVSEKLATAAKKD